MQESNGEMPSQMECVCVCENSAIEQEGEGRKSRKRELPEVLLPGLYMTFNSSRPAMMEQGQRTKRRYWCTLRGREFTCCCLLLFTYSASFIHLTAVRWKNTGKEGNSTPCCGKIKFLLKLEVFSSHVINRKRRTLPSGAPGCRLDSCHNLWDMSKEAFK